ncbi:hypothetical protein BC832DRAFT_316703 [Gaertneriomyces semiglobifer]|nr:hypothetical protein BC832DRAFT_316703 [Gaertneriomyces semiglobifer]
MLLKPPELNMLSALQLASKLLRPKDDKPVRLKTSVSRVICALAEIHPKVLETITRSRVGNSNLMDFVVAHTHSEFRQLTAGLRHQQALDTSDHLRCTTFHALVRLLYRIVCHRGLRLEVADTDGVSLTIKNATRHLLMAMLVRLARMRESEWDALAGKFSLLPRHPLVATKLTNRNWALTVLAREVLQHVDDKPDIHADN